MTSTTRILYSFPHRIGATRICETAWYQVTGAARAGANVMVHPASVERSLPDGVRVAPTLAHGRFRIPYRAVGSMRAFALHDIIVSRRLGGLADVVDVVHAWPLGARRTLREARRLGIPTVLERPNAHTRFAYEVVRDESARLSVSLPADQEHSFNFERLRIEEEEYELADYLLCPSEFVVKSFVEQGVPRDKLLRTIYGFDESRFFPTNEPTDPHRGLMMLFVGVAAVRKGLHFALEAWLASPASERGTFAIAGDVLPAYAEKLAPMLAHPSVRVLGHRTDVPDLMRASDILVLPSIEEGFGLVCVEAMGCGAVPLVSDACTDACVHMENALVHAVGDVAALASHITLLEEDRGLLTQLRAASLAAAPRYTWDAAGIVLADAYREAIADRSGRVAMGAASSS